jgi:hypothetical protein
MAVYDWILGLGLVFGLALFLMFFMKSDMRGFFPLATIICVFVVYAGLLESWVLIALMIVDVVIIFYEVKMKGGRGM